MSEKNIVETVNINGELDVNGDKWMMEKIRSGPCTVTQGGPMQLPRVCPGAEIVMLRDPNLIFSVVHFSPLTSDLPFTFTISILFSTDVYRYMVW